MAPGVPVADALPGVPAAVAGAVPVGPTMIALAVGVQLQQDHLPMVSLASLGCTTIDALVGALGLMAHAFLRRLA